MLMEDFNNWVALPSNREKCTSEDAYDNFSLFFRENYLGKSYFDVVADLALQIYEVQVCIEGVIQDLENCIG